MREFAIDGDGAFISGPKLEVHLGWEQLEQIENPSAAFKAKPKQPIFPPCCLNRMAEEDAGNCGWQ